MTEGTKALTLTEFLLARIAEWETFWPMMADTAEYMGGRIVDARAMMAADCKAKRRIVEEHEIGIDPCDAHDGYTMRSIPCDTVLTLATVYADHPDYRDEWRV